MLKKVTTSDILLIDANIMESLIKMLENSYKQGVQAGSGVQEDAILAMSALIEKLGSRYARYMPIFLPYLTQALKNTAEYQVCFVAVNCVGDLCRALQSQMNMFTDEIMGILLMILGVSNIGCQCTLYIHVHVLIYCVHWLMLLLQDDKVDRSVKPGVLSVFGDVALAIGPEFQKYLDLVVLTLQQASMLQVDRVSMSYSIMSLCVHILIVSNCNQC